MSIPDEIAERKNASITTVRMATTHAPSGRSLALRRPRSPARPAASGSWNNASERPDSIARQPAASSAVSETCWITSSLLTRAIVPLWWCSPIRKHSQARRKMGQAVREGETRTSTASRPPNPKGCSGYARNREPRQLRARPPSAGRRLSLGARRNRAPRRDPREPPWGRRSRTTL